MDYRSFLHFETIGVMQCMKMCKRYRLCEKIHHNREQLSCDLMRTSAEKGNIASLLDVDNVQIDNSGCWQHDCSDHEVCVDKNDGEYLCIPLDVCPSAAWVPFNGKCYYFKGTKSTADANIEYCTSIDSNPVRIDNEDVDSFLKKELMKRGLDNMWLAVNDKEVEGEWVWGPGDPVSYTGWAMSEPNDLFNGENCACLWQAGWRDFDCLYKAGLACEIPYNISRISLDCMV